LSAAIFALYLARITVGSLIMPPNQHKSEISVSATLPSVGALPWASAWRNIQAKWCVPGKQRETTKIVPGKCGAGKFVLSRRRIRIRKCRTH
jgi:hypothetical protein